MCTLTLAWQAFRDEPVVVAANRDELLDRAAEPPARRALAPEGGWIGDDPHPEADGGVPTDDGVGVVAPRDAVADGTWTGYNDRGLYVGVTNRWVEGLAAERSRGLLVRDALARADAESAVGAVERAVAAHQYDGFNLVVADAAAAFLIEWDGDLAITRLSPGVHVVVNVGAALGGGTAPADRFFVPEVRPAPAERQADNARAVRAALTVEPGETADEWVGRAKSVLGDHDYGVCVHGDDDDPEAPPASFGTRSSSVIRLGDGVDDAGDGRYEFADGPPCVTPYAPIDARP